MNICIKFIKDERIEYDEFKLRNYCPHLYMRNSSFFYAVDNIVKDSQKSGSLPISADSPFLSYRRKEIVYSANARVKCVTDLVSLIHGRAKIIIFGERIEMSNEIYERLNTLLPNESGIYHSKMHKDVRKAALRKFEDSQIRILENA